LYTLEMGKLRAIAKGARKPRSRKAGHLEPFMRSSLQLARGRDILLVNQAETQDPHLRLREELLPSTYAAYVVELLDRFTYEEGENRALYRLLADTLSRLCTHSSPELVVRYYEIRLLDLLGFRPQLYQCAHCGVEIQPQDQYFSAEMGGVLCPRCGRDFGIWPVSMRALKYLRYFQRSPFSEAERVTLSAGVNREMEALMQQYLTYLLERSLNTPAFLRHVRRVDL